MKNNMYSTPIQARNDGTVQEDVIMTGSSSSTVSTGSILRSSSNYMMRHMDSSAHKRVTIVSPIKWRSQSPHSLNRRRNFINSTILYSDMVDILGYDADSPYAPSYEECVDTLLNLDWSPENKYVENVENQRERAMPTIPTGERAIYLKCTDTKYLSMFSTKCLKEWLCAQGIEASMDQNKYEYIKLIKTAHPFLSPASCDVAARINRCAGDPNNKLKTMSRTPHRLQHQIRAMKSQRMGIRKQLSFE